MPDRRAILLIGNYPPPYGGVPTHLKYLAPHLVGRGWDVHVLTQKYREPPEERVDRFTVYGLASRLLPTRLAYAAIEARKAWHARSVVQASGPRELLRCLEMYRRAAAIVTANPVRIISAYHVFPSGLVALWLAQETGLPFVTTIFGELYWDPEWARRQRHLVREVLEGSARLLSCSRHCAESPKAVGLSHVAEVVYYGIDVERFSPAHDGQRLRARLGMAPDDPTVLFVGRMVREMGLHTLLSAIPRVLQARARVRFVIAGQAGALHDEAMQLRETYPEAIHVLADVGDDDLPLLYAAAHLVVVPSANERACLGLAAAEAMASGKPVIVTTAGGGPEVLIDDETGLLIPPENPEALAKAILRVVADPICAGEMGRRGRERACELFDKNRTNATMARIFTEVADA